MFLPFTEFYGGSIEKIDTTIAKNNKNRKIIRAARENSENSSLEGFTAVSSIPLVHPKTFCCTSLIVVIILYRLPTD